MMILEIIGAVFGVYFLVKGIILLIEIQKLIDNTRSK